MVINQAYTLSEEHKFLILLANIGNVCCVLCPFFIVDKMKAAKLNSSATEFSHKYTTAFSTDLNECIKSTHELIEYIKNSLADIIDISTTGSTAESITEKVKLKFFEFLERIKNSTVNSTSLLDNNLFIDFIGHLRTLNNKVIENDDSNITSIKQSIEVILKESSNLYESLASRNRDFLGKVLAENYSFFHTIIEFVKTTNDTQSGFSFNPENINNVFITTLHEDATKISQSTSGSNNSYLEPGGPSYKTSY